MCACVSDREREGSEGGELVTATTVCPWLWAAWLKASAAPEHPQVLGGPGLGPGPRPQTESVPCLLVISMARPLLTAPALWPDLAKARRESSGKMVLKFTAPALPEKSIMTKRMRQVLYNLNSSGERRR